MSLKKEDKREIGRRGRNPYAVQPRKPSLQRSSDKPKPGIGSLQKADIEKNNKIKQVKAKYASLKETARDELTPMKSDRVFSKFRNPEGAKEFYADKPGSKYEGLAKEAMQDRINYYKKMKRGGLTPGLKNYVKKDNSEEALIKAFKKNSNQAIFVKKSEIMKNPGDYTPVEGNLEKMLKPKNKKTGGISKIDKLRSTKGQFTIEGRIQTLKEKLKKNFGKKSGGLTGGRKKLDKNKDGKITGKDFKMMRKGYGAARKDGMGLQDESIKPGKVMKANLGLLFMKKAKDKGAKGLEFLSPLAMAKKVLGRSKGGGADMGTEMSDKRKKKFKEILARLKAPRTINIKPEFKSGTSNPMQRDRKREGYRAKVEKLGGRVMFADEIGMKKFKNFMGGGMMNKPMGYKKGASIMARGCKLGRKKATKLY